MAKHGSICLLQTIGEIDLLMQKREQQHKMRRPRGTSNINELLPTSSTPGFTAYNTWFLRSIGTTSEYNKISKKKNTLPYQEP